ncbi:hypothetical protein N2152v2_004921 [Parachlorella kessleri]
MSSSKSALSRGLRENTDEEQSPRPTVAPPPRPPPQSPPTSAALPITSRSGHAINIPSQSSSLHRGGSGVFAASPAWGDTPSSYSENQYGASPIWGTPMPYLSLDQQYALPVQHETEDEEGAAADQHDSFPARIGSLTRASLHRSTSQESGRSASLLAQAGLGASLGNGASASAPSSAAAAAASAAAAAAAKRGEDGGLTEPLLLSPEFEPSGDRGVNEAKPRGGQSLPETPLSRALVFGSINSIATVPTLIAFAAIVFKAPVYAPYIDLLCKFFFLASAVIQAVFCMQSSLPYAIGQVQDVGLIFLSAMASSIAVLCAEAGRDAATALGTSLLTMTVCTFLVGLGTLAVSKFKLAGLVQYLPLPVVGGYLGFVGYFCIASGVGLGAGVAIDTIPSWAHLASWDALCKLLPTLASCAAMMITLEKVAHPLGLPAVMVSIVAAFHLTLLGLGVTLKQAQHAGWAMEAPEGSQKFWELWDLYNIHGFNLDGVYLQAAVRQVGKFFGLLLVVCFGSCMDIAAIQQDTPQKIDFDRELRCVAVANMVVGVAGCGYTGSYIFSQTVFTMRAGVFSRWNGVVVVIAEFGLFLLPFSVVQYMPNFFYGALLLWFGIEISRDWLVLSFRKLTVTEYVLLWLSFATIMQLGLEMGIGLGIVMAALYFSYAYAKSQVTGLGLVHMRSGVVRTLEQQAALDLFDARLVTARLRGFIFFGSANSIGIKLHQAAQGLVESDHSALRFSESAELAVDHSRRTVGEGYEALKITQAQEALARAPRYMLLDFTHATGLDATGARTFGILCRDLLELGITPLVTGIQETNANARRELLEAHGVPLKRKRWPPPLPSPLGSTEAAAAAAEAGLGGSAGDLSGATMAQGAAEAPQWLSSDSEVEQAGEWRCLEFTTLEEGLRYCEDHFVEVAVDCGLCPAPTARVTLEALLRSHLPKVPFHPSADPAQMAHSLLQYLGRRSLAPGEYLWRRGNEANDCYIIEKGSVRLITYQDESPKAGLRLVSREARRSRMPHSHVVSTHEYGPGCVVGALDLYLQRPRASTALATSQGGAKLLRLSSAKLAALAGEAPAALNLVQAVLMRAICRDLAVAMEAASQTGSD